MNDGNPDAATDSAAPSAGQTALLQHLGVLPAEPLTQAEAAALIAQLEAAPDWQPHLQAWHRDKFQLHPELFATPQRSFREGRWWQSQIADGNLYSYSFRQPSVSQTLVILESLDRQLPGWDQESKKRRTHRFMNELATLSPELCKPGCAFPHELPEEGDDSEDLPTFDAPARPLSTPDPYAAISVPVAALSASAWQTPMQPPLRTAGKAITVGKAASARTGAGIWALLLFALAAGVGAYGYFGIRAAAPVRDNTPASTILVTDQPGGHATSQPATVLPTLMALDSQQRAMERYPDLSRSGTPLNQRFIASVHKLEVERSPRLQQPDWPEQLANEAAVALSVPAALPKPPAPPAPQVAAASPPAPPAPPAQKATAPTPAPVAQRTAFVPAAPPAAAATPVTPPVVVAAAATPRATPRPAPGSMFVALDAVNKASTNHYTYNWITYYGDYDLSFRQSVGIDVTLHNMKHDPASTTLRWAFFSRGTGHGGTRNIFAAAEKHLDLAPGQTITEAIDSPMIRGRETVYYDYGRRYLVGSKYDGWLVQVLPEGSSEIIKQVGSSSYLEDYGKRSDFDGLFKEAAKKKGASE